MQPLRILTVCTGNICRSPVAAKSLEMQLNARGVPASVTSSGLRGGGKGDKTTIKAAAERGIDISDHRSRKVDRYQLRTDGADLVIGMTRGHVVDLAAVDPYGFPKTFTLAELVRRAEALPPDTRADSFAEWRDLIGTDRTPAVMLAGSPRDDVADPHRRRMKYHRDSVEHIEQLSTRLAELLSKQLALPERSNRESNGESIDWLS